MDRMELYNGFRIRAYQDWSGLWLAETKKPLRRRPGAGDHDDTDAEYIATPSGHPTPEAAVDLVMQLIDSEGTQGSPQTKPSNEDNSGEAMMDALRAIWPAHALPSKRK
jgi:hypothetical protein